MGAAIEIVNPRNAVTRLDDADVSTVRIADGQGGPERTIVNESGLYDLIFVSRKPAVKRFKRWVTKEVLPEIRRTGTYGLVGIDLPTALERYAAALREKDATPRGVFGVFRQLIKHGVGERRWGALPTEDELFKKITFEVCA